MYEFRTRPFEHQRRALKASSDARSFAYLMEMGTGKSKVIIDEIGSLFCSGDVDCAVIFAPKGVCSNWVSGEIPAHMGLDATVVRWEAGGGNKENQRRLKDALTHRGRLRVLVINTESLSSGTRALSYVREFIKSGRCYGVVDESTFIKNPGSKRTSRVLDLRDLLQFRRIATGSPVASSPLDLYSQFEFLEPSCLGFRSYYAFRARFAVLQTQRFGGRKFQVVVGFRNLEELSERVGRHSFRVTKDECLDLPAKIYTRREVELTEEQRRVYHQVRSFTFAELECGAAVSATNVITKILRLHQIVCGHVTDENGDARELSSNRVSALMDVLAETRGDVVIWANYRRDIDAIVRAVKKEYGEGSAAQFHGGNTRTRDAEAERFKSDRDCRFMIATQSAGGFGNTWVNATTVVYYSNNYDYEKRMQSEDRTHRAGQGQPVTYIDLVTPGTVDEKILSALRRKLNIATLINGDNYREWVV